MLIVTSRGRKRHPEGVAPAARGPRGLSMAADDEDHAPGALPGAGPSNRPKETWLGAGAMICGGATAGAAGVARRRSCDPHDKQSRQPARDRRSPSRAGPLGRRDQRLARDRLAVAVASPSRPFDGDDPAPHVAHLASRDAAGPRSSPLRNTAPRRRLRRPPGLGEVGGQHGERAPGDRKPGVGVEAAAGELQVVGADEEDAGSR